MVLRASDGICARGEQVTRVSRTLDRGRSDGQGNLFRGQENKEMFFPTTIKFFPTPRDVPVVKEGWACKGASGVKGGVFKKSQRDFLVTLFNNNGGPKIRERDPHMRMKTKFVDRTTLFIVGYPRSKRHWSSPDADSEVETVLDSAYYKHLMTSVVRSLQEAISGGKTDGDVMELSPHPVD